MFVLVLDGTFGGANTILYRTGGFNARNMLQFSGVAGA
jgi:hypothetical protein